MMLGDLLMIRIDCDNQTAAKVVQRLKKEGFLVRTFGANKRGFRQTRKALFHIVEDGSERVRMMDAYFDPTTKIAHHVRFRLCLLQLDWSEANAVSQFEIPRPLPDTVKTTQFSLPPQDLEMGEAETPILPRGDTTHELDPMTVPDSMEEYAGPIDSEETPTVKRHNLLAAKHADQVQSEDLTTELANQVTSTRQKRGRTALTKRDPNPSTPVRTSARKRVYQAEADEEDEPLTPTPAGKKIKCSRAPVVNVGRSPTHSMISVVDDENDEDFKEL
jgi:hypothetical protein